LETGLPYHRMLWLRLKEGHLRMCVHQIQIVQRQVQRLVAKSRFVSTWKVHNAMLARRRFKDHHTADNIVVHSK